MPANAQGSLTPASSRRCCFGPERLDDWVSPLFQRKPQTQSPQNPTPRFSSVASLLGVNKNFCCSLAGVAGPLEVLRCPPNRPAPAKPAMPTRAPTRSNRFQGLGRKGLSYALRSPEALHALSQTPQQAARWCKPELGCPVT